MGATATVETLRVDDLYLQPSSMYRVTGIGLGSPVPRDARFPRAERHGSSDHTEFYEGRVIPIRGLVVADDDATLWEAWDELKAKLALGADRTLTFRRRGLSFDERVVARVASEVDDNTLPVDDLVIRWSVSLFAGDPRIYSSALRSTQYDPAAALSGGGVAFPLTFPLEFSTTTVSVLEVANDGKFKTPPVLRVNGPVIDPSIDNDTTGDSIRIGYSLGSSDVVVVDVGARTVTLNGAERADLFDARESTWWELARGTNRLRLRGTGMALGVTALTAEYRDARI